MGGCQNYGTILGTLNIKCRIILRTPKGTLILTTTHIHEGLPRCFLGVPFFKTFGIYDYDGQSPRQMMKAMFLKPLFAIRIGVMSRYVETGQFHPQHAVCRRARLGL